MNKITIDNLTVLQQPPKPGQRVLMVAPGVWLPVGISGTTSSDSSLPALEAGYIDENGNFQPLSFNGTQASSSGSAIEGLTKSIFNTGVAEPQYGGSIQTGIPSDYIFYASLSDSHSKAQTGQNLTKVGTISYSSYKGVPCGLFGTQGSYLQCALTGISSNALTFSMWVFLDTSAGQSGGDYPRFLSVGYSENADQAVNWLCFTLDTQNQNITFQFPDNNNWTTSAGSVVRNQWLHLVGTFYAGDLTLYINGTAGTTTRAVYTLNLPTTSTIYMNFINSQYNFGIDGNRLAALRIYNRVLTQTQITALAAEFAPTA